jgi:hypothetical protein
MSGHRDDEGLRGRFQHLREETEQDGRVPDFDAMMARARADAASSPTLEVVDGGQGARRGPDATRRRVFRLGGWASAALAAALAGLLLLPADRDGDEFDALVASFSSSTTLQSPTAGLLDVPGIEFVRSMPSVGGSLRGAGLEERPSPPGSEGTENRL